MIRINKKNLFIFIGIFVLNAANNAGMIPVLGNILQQISNLYFLILVLSFVCLMYKGKFHYKISSIIIYILLFNVIYVLSCYVNQGAFGFHQTISLMKRIVSLIWIDYLTQKDFNYLFGPIFKAFSCWVVLDSLFTLLYPNGSALFGGVYLLGGKNNKIQFFFIVSLLFMYQYYTIKDSLKKRKKLMTWFFLSVLMVINALLIESSTTALVSILLFSYPFINRFISKFKIFNFPFFASLHGLLWYIIIIGNKQVTLLSSITKALFGKDSTFTGRVYIWNNALQKISQSLLIGYGDYSIQTVKLPGNIMAPGYRYDYEWNMAHNQILELFMRGGILLFASWVGILISCFYKKDKESNISRAAIWSLISFSFFWLMEADILQSIPLLLIFIGTHFSSYMKRGLYE